MPPGFLDEGMGSQWWGEGAEGRDAQVGHVSVSLRAEAELRVPALAWAMLPAIPSSPPPSQGSGTSSNFL